MGKVLVTGADGFIGSHLTETLVRSGHDVRAFCLYNSFGTWGWLENSSPEIKKNLDVYLGDVRDPFGVRKALEGCDAVLHLASLIAIPFSYHQPATYVETNIGGTLNVLQASRELGLSKVVHTSTSEVYGTAQFVPITEEHPHVGQSPYSASKIGADQMAESFYRSFGVPVTIIRPFNTYGPRQSARAVIPSIITQLANGKTELSLGALNPTRDFNFVEDTVAGFIAALKTDGIAGQTINLASRFEITIGDTAKSISRLMGRDVRIAQDDERMRPAKSEVERLFGENAKAKKLLGWEPKYGGLEGFERGLKKTIDWFQDPENLKMYKADRYNI